MTKKNSGSEFYHGPHYQQKSFAFGEQEKVVNFQKLGFILAK